MVFEQCAPGKTYDGENKTCFTLENIRALVVEYNNTYDDRIKISKNKKDMMRQLISKMKKKFNCDNDVCITKSRIVKTMSDKDMKEDIENSYRPIGPADTKDWLSTKDINSVMHQYELKYKNFKFFGAVPYDFQDLPVYGFNNINFDEIEKLYEQIGLIINLDTHDMSGSHWVGLYVNLKDRKIYYFDSVGKKPGQNINIFVRKILTHMFNKMTNKNFNVEQFMKEFHSSDDFDVRYNRIQHQFKNSECGVYSMNFIIRLLEGETFDDIVNTITKDEEMAKNRLQYFNPK
jgi:hypothetical protein